MPRNDQITRQWFVLRELESSRGKTLAEIGRALPKEYRKHERTIRRDLEALESAGFPLMTETLDGHVRWRLMDGFHKRPSVSLSPTELMALRMARTLLSPLEGTVIQTTLESALFKAQANLPGVESMAARDLVGVFSFGLGSHKTYGEHRHTIDALTKAISKLHTVQIRYFSAARWQLTRREVNPYRLWYTNGALYLIGYCHLRKDVRMFAVERIKSLTVTNHPFQMPLGFDLEAYVQDALGSMRGKPITVELQFDKATAAWVRDRIWHATQHLTPLKNGCLNMMLTVADNRELIGWILSFGRGVRVLKPDSLKRAVKEEARYIVTRD